jgi:hypothetical protein
MSSALPFGTLTLAAFDEEGNIDEAKMKALRQLFRPVIEMTTTESY